MARLTPQETTQLLEHVRREARARHRRSLPAGAQLSEAQRKEYQQMSKDYRSFVRMGDYPPRVERLAKQILSARGHTLGPDQPAYREFCLAITTMLAELYTDILADDPG